MNPKILDPKKKSSMRGKLVLFLFFPILLTFPQTSHSVIKGNINSRGEKIYHVPGGKYYEQTVIEPEKGERWFCSEAEASAAGWRRSDV